MSSDWPMAQLGDYCNKIGSGATPRGGASVYLDKGEICLIRSQNVYNDGFKPEGLVYITDESAKKLKNVVVEENDVLLNITGDSVARVCLAKKEYLPARVNQHVAIIRPNPNEFDPRYVRYILASDSMQSYLLTIASVGATRNALTKAMIESLEIPKPAIGLQSFIADHLEALENKIELNIQTNQTLEQIAQAIFKSWFVDFEPVKAKIAAKAKLSCSPLPLGEGVRGVRAGTKARGKTPKTLLANARKLRQSATDAEQLLWKLLRGRQVNNAKFRRQHPVGKYILDFYCHDLKLAIELDGSQHNEAEYKQKDAQRTAWLNQQGIQVIRFWNNQVLQETEAVMEVIYNAVSNRPSQPSPPAPLPEGEGGLGAASLAEGEGRLGAASFAGGERDLEAVSVLEGDKEHPSVTLAAMIAISGKDETALKQLQAEHPDQYAELAQTAALFPSAMVESELGEIPEGWEVSTIGESYKVVMGQSPKGDTYNENKKGTLFYQGRAEFGWRFPSPRLYTTDPKRMATQGDILMSVRAPVGDLNIALEDCCIGRGLSALRHKCGSTSFTYYQMKELQKKFETFDGEGTVFGSINQKDLKGIKIVNPSGHLVKLFIKKVTVFDQEIENRSNEIINLNSIRDTLLPKLLSGEIDLSQLQAAAEQEGK